jgi:glyoxylase-like metal-dependent hydrolase (beta-lactamase superfamily II)
MLGGLDALVSSSGRPIFYHLFHVDHLGLVSTHRATPSESPDAPIPKCRKHLRWLSSRRLINSPKPPRGGGPLALRWCQDGQVISAGGYNFRCIAAPGHSFDICLHEEGKLFLQGDHILETLPNIQAWTDDWNPLKVPDEPNRTWT